MIKPMEVMFLSRIRSESRKCRHQFRREREQSRRLVVMVIFFSLTQHVAYPLVAYTHNMPPFVPRKREHSPEHKSSPKPVSTEKPARKASRFKPSLFDSADAPTTTTKSAEETKKYLESLDQDEESDELSEVDSDEFEDVAPPAAKRLKQDNDGDDDDEEEDEGMDWEDAFAAGASTTQQVEPEIGDIDISMKDDGTGYVEPLVSLATGKKAPSKRERQIRMLTHCLHVQSLLWHNTVRNSWLNDKEVQKTLVDNLSEGVKREVKRWRESMGMLSAEELAAKKREAARKNAKGKKEGKGRERDWGSDATHAEPGVPNLSQGDPLLRLLKVLTAYWRKRFTVTAPGLRKKGYMPLRRLRDDIRDWEKDHNDIEEFGERIEGREAFRELAKKCEGSRDVGAQLFVALLRGLGLETRMVANLQPIGLGTSKAEEADPKRTKKEKKADTKAAEKADAEEAKADLKKNAQTNGRKPAKRKSARGSNVKPIKLDDSDSDSDLSNPPSDAEPTRVKSKASNNTRPVRANKTNLSTPNESDSSPTPSDAVVDISDDDDDLSIVDITPSTPKKPNKKYDRDMAFPTYWTEVLSSVSHKYIPVDPIVLSTIASNDELLQTFEPRGKKADKAKQVIAYTIAYSSDGSAKDVTVRYLKKHQMPGKTKGQRMYPEKVPVYNKRGKVKKYEDYDWFRTVMSMYDRPEAKRTAADDLEEQTDLKIFKPVKETKEVDKESLAWYKQSAEFVLELHLRREEALLPGAKPVKTFTAGKGDKAKTHDVFRRDDVVTCKTVESWHKDGRAVKIGEQPIKYVPTRAVTLIRKREIESSLRETGQKAMQGLYSRSQTEWIIPDPIGPDGKIPKNAYGNMDVYVPTMVPQGAVHLPLKGSAKICRKLAVDYAEACTGFEFGKQRAVPVLTGVVVAEEHEDLVRDAWKTEQVEIKRKEDTKRTGVALGVWRKFLMGLRIVERMKVEYQDAGGEESNPFVRRAKKDAAVDAGNFEDSGAGGFFRPGHEEEEVPQHRKKDATMHDVEEDGGGGFLVEDEGDNADVDMDAGGGFLVEDNGDTSARASTSATTPMSLQDMHKNVPDDEEGSDDEGLGEEEEEEKEEQSPPPTKKAKKAVPTKAKRRARAAPKSKPVKKPAKRAATPVEEDESSLSDALSDASSQPTKSYKSPQVVVKKHQPAKGGRRNSTRTAAAKSTPVRSQYFVQGSDEDDNEDDKEEEEEDSDDEVEEVVQPRKTTARTRRRR